MYTARRITAERSRVRLVNRLLPHDRLEAEVEKPATKIAKALKNDRGGLG